MKKLCRIQLLVQGQYANSKPSFYIYMTLRLIIFGIIIISIVKGRYEHLLQCSVALLYFCIPPFFERTFKADVPTVIEIICLFFIFSANILGEIFSFYLKVPFWDTMLHAIYGFCCAGLGFSLFDLLNKDRDPELKFKLNPFYHCINAVGLTTIIAVLWEFIEFIADVFFGKDMQKDTVLTKFQTVYLDPTQSNIPVVFDNITDTVVNGIRLEIDGYLDIGLYDTMKDMGVAMLGSVLFCFFLIPYIKSNGKNKFAALFIPTRRNWEENPPDSKIYHQIAKNKLNNNHKKERNF